MRTYKLVAVREDTGERVMCCPGPLTHAEACTARTKFTPTKRVRIELEEITP